MATNAIQVDSFEQGSQRADLLALWRDNLEHATGAQDSSLDRRFEWLYSLNPCGPPTTCVARGPQRLLGCASLFPRQLYLAGQEHLVGTCCDFAVDREHRVFGPALQIQRSLIDSSFAHGYQLLLSWPNDASYGLFRRVGFEELAPSERWVKVLRLERCFGILKDIPLVPTLSRLAARGLERLDRALGLLSPRALGRLHTEILSDVDSRFDELWAAARTHHRVAEVRSSAYLGWRYAKAPGRRYQFCCLLDERRECLYGYVVFTVRQNVVCVEDLLARDNATVLDLLLSTFIAAMHREGAAAISVVFLQNELLRSKLRRLLFLPADELRAANAAPRVRDKLKRLFSFRREPQHPLLLYWPPAAPVELQRAMRAAVCTWQLFNGGMDLW